MTIEYHQCLIKTTYPVPNVRKIFLLPCYGSLCSQPSLGLPRDKDSRPHLSVWSAISNIYNCMPMFYLYIKIVLINRSHLRLLPLTFLGTVNMNKHRHALFLTVWSLSQQFKVLYRKCKRKVNKKEGENINRTFFLNAISDY